MRKFHFVILFFSCAYLWVCPFGKCDFRIDLMDDDDDDDDDEKDDYHHEELIIMKKNEEDE